MQKRNALMPGAYEISKKIKIALEKNGLIAESFKNKVAYGSVHKVDPKAYDVNAEELVWVKVHNYSKDFFNFKSGSNPPPIKKNRETYDGEDFDLENNVDKFNKKMIRLQNPNAQKHDCLSELLTLRAALLENLLGEKVDVKLTLSILSDIIADEVPGIEKKDVYRWLMKVNNTFARHVFDPPSKEKLEEDMQMIENSDPLKTPLAELLKNLKEASENAEKENVNLSEEYNDNDEEDWDKEFEFDKPEAKLFSSSFFSKKGSTPKIKANSDKKTKRPK